MKSEQEIRAEIIERQYAEDLAAVMATRAGRNVLHRIIARTGPMLSTFDHDPNIHAYRSGAADIGKSILTDVLLHAPGDYHVMMLESIDDPAKRGESADRLARMVITISKAIGGNPQ